MKKNENYTECRFKNVVYYHINSKITKAVITTYPFNKKFFGISKLDPRDTYDEEVGEKIALARALDKMSAYNLAVYENMYRDVRLAYEAAMTKIDAKRRKNNKNIRKANNLYEEAARRITGDSGECVSDSGSDRLGGSE